MESTFIALLHNLSITEGLGLGDKISDSLRITNDVSIVKRLISPPHRQLLGEMETASLLAGAPVVFGEQAIPADRTPEQHLVANLYEVQSLLMTTWIVRDNAINCELGFLLYGKADAVSATSNFIAHQYSTARGEIESVSLSRDQLREMRALHRDAIRPPDHPFRLPTSQLTAAHPRVSRAIYLINAARGQSDIGIKIAHYCTAFETLFATSQTELAHQLAERVACYLHGTVADRLANYRRLKAAYALRSKVVHGSTLRQDRVQEAVQTSEYCDEVARKLLRKVLTAPGARQMFDKDQEGFDEEMLKLIFGTPE